MTSKMADLVSSIERMLDDQRNIVKLGLGIKN